MDPRLFLADLEAKPGALRGLAMALETTDPWSVLAGDVRRVVFVGMGSSRYAARVAALRLRGLGVDAVAEYASALNSYPADDQTLIVAISATGSSRETLDFVRSHPGSRVVALSNTAESPLAGLAELVVPMRAGVEAGGVACRTFQHTLLLLLSLAARLGGGKFDAADLARRAADASGDLLARRDEWLPPTLELLDGPAGVYAIAPVERLSSADQSALMLREGPRRAATACETGDWSHVDVYLTKTLDYRALLFPGSRYDEQLMQWMRERGSTVVAVGAEVPGVASTIRYAFDDDPDVRLLTETLVAELVAAAWWQ